MKSFVRVCAAAGLICVSALVGCAAETTAPSSRSSNNANGKDDDVVGKKKTLDAPKLERVAPMEGVLHITWTADDACETIEAERKGEMADMKSWAKAFSIDAEAGNKMDSEATHPTKYTYRLRCKSGSELSAYSNEISATPRD